MSYSSLAAERDTGHPELVTVSAYLFAGWARRQSFTFGKQ